ncbi:MAG: hypothetical protein J6Y03_05260 [Alphaproteobacteria bacterium]|nr:hypothetical protein [Alphaproteobacteria bacterium]
MKKLLHKLEQCLTFERNTSGFLKKSRGRTMLETLAVLAVLGLLTIGSIKGLNAVFMKSRINKILDDAAKTYTILSVSKKFHENWVLTLPADKSQSGFDFSGKQAIKEVNDETNGPIMTYVRVNLPKDFCTAVLEEQAEGFSIHKASASGEISTYSLTECEDENDVVFIFNMARSCASDRQCLDKYGKGYICINGSCIRRECEDDYDCKSGETCVAGMCKSEAGCTYDDQCAAGHICVEGICIKACESNNDCPEGQKCITGEGICSSACSFDTDCPDGYKCSYGNCITDVEYNKCRNSADCPNGKYCFNSACMTCGTDRYWNSVQQNCLDCPSDATCNGADGTCKNGYTGHYKSDGTLACCSNDLHWNGSECGNCPTGAICNGTEKITCPNGEYDPILSRCQNYACHNWDTVLNCCLDDGRCTCRSCCSHWNSEFKCCMDSGCNTGEEACENGYVSHGGYRGTIRCCHPTREYWNGDNCSACPAGCTCDGTTSSCFDSSCPGGSDWNGAQTVCCQTGEVLLEAGTRGDHICCPEGTPYAIDKTGYNTSIPQHQDYTCADVCQAGTYVNGKQCSTCPAGTYSSAASTSCTTCPAGTYSAAGSESCTQCPAGTYSTAGSESCTECPEGTYSSAGSESCTECPEGTYYSATSSTKCKPCPNYASCSDGNIVCNDGYTLSGGTCLCLSRSCCSNWNSEFNCCKDTGCTSVETCAPGYVAHGGQRGVVRCCNEETQYWNGDNCSDCPEGCTCDGTTSSCFDSSCPGGSRWNGIQYVCCQAGEVVLRAGTRADYICCPEGTPYAIDKTGYNTSIPRHQDYICAPCSSCGTCPEGYACDGSNLVGCATNYTAHYDSKGTLHCCRNDNYWTGSSCTSCPTGATCDGSTLTSCGPGKYLTADKTCKNCDDLYRSTTATDDDCLVCADRTVEFGYCDWICPLSWFRNANGNCTRCTESNKKETSKTECDKCNYTGSPHVRTYDGTYCKY